MDQVTNFTETKDKILETSQRESIVEIDRTEKNMNNSQCENLSNHTESEDQNLEIINCNSQCENSVQDWADRIENEAINNSNIIQNWTQNILRNWSHKIENEELYMQKDINITKNSNYDDELTIHCTDETLLDSNANIKTNEEKISNADVLTIYYTDDSDNILNVEINNESVETIDETLKKDNNTSIIMNNESIDVNDSNKIKIDEVNEKTKYIKKINYDNTPIMQNIERLSNIFGLLCMSFKSGPYEYTLTTMTEYIWSTEKNWVQHLNYHIQLLGITELYVLGPAQKSIISNYVACVPIYALSLYHLPVIKEKCPTCLRYGCSKFKAAKIMEFNFRYPFVIPCTYKN